MHTSKTILLFTLLGTAIMFALGLTDPNSPAMWLASSSMNFAILRIVMMVMLAALLVTHPPRNVYLRIIIGLFSMSLAGWTMWATYQNAMKFMDSMDLMLFSISAGLIVLESKYLPVEPSEEERLAEAREARRLALS